MLHVWLIPAGVVILVVIATLYLVLRRWGGSGVRTDGRALVDLPDENPPEDDR